MQTNFTDAQLKDPQINRSNEILRNCVHCGFCTATCPTYQVLGDELDSPRGRIYLAKDMLEKGKKPDAHTVKHIDRCLSCLACMTTCPSGVHYMHLIDHAREYIEENYQRPLFDRLLRWGLAQVLPYPGRFRLAMRGAKLAKPIAPLLPKKISNMIDMAPPKLARPTELDKPQIIPAEGARKYRVALMTGCAQKALDAEINASTVRLLTRHGVEVVIAKGAGCCGALSHHMGRSTESHTFAAANIEAWHKELDGEGLDAVILNTSGCGTTIKDYGHMFRNDSLAEKAAAISAITKDISEFMETIGIAVKEKLSARVAYHSACSLQHGQQVKMAPKVLLKQAGFKVVEPRDPHLCCGSAGTYNLLQPEISQELKARKVETLVETKPDFIVAGNIGCMMQIGSAINVPVLHLAEALDWATGGKKPKKLA